jgi:serine/threonine-protein kinase
MRLFLEVISGPYQGKRIEAGVGRVVRIGRTEQADIALEDNFLSSVHFAIECDLKSCRVRDLNSRNGTKLNGIVVTEATLTDGDQVHQAEQIS